MSQFRNLVFEGGGVKGIAYAGALEILETQNIMPDIKRVAGTSAGAITATLVALGADSEQVARIVGGTRFREFMDDSFGWVRDTQRFFSDYGWYKGDAFSEWMRNKVDELVGDPEFTFGEMRRRAGLPNRNYKELFIVGSNLTNQAPMVYSAETTPEMPIWEAARISMSIPLFFRAVKRENDVYVDGGVTWNYPLDLFDDRKYVEPMEAWVPEKPNYPTVYDENHIYNIQTLGFRVDTADEIKAEKESWKLPPAKITDFFGYLKAVIGFMTDTANKMHLHTNDWHRTIALDASGIRATDFDLTDVQVTLLTENGRKGATEYFQWFNDGNSDPAPINRISA